MSAEIKPESKRTKNTYIFDFLDARSKGDVLLNGLFLLLWQVISIFFDPEQLDFLLVNLERMHLIIVVIIQ